MNTPENTEQTDDFVRVDPLPPCSPSSDTPETDAASCYDGTFDSPANAIEFARKLERERNEAREELKNAAARIYKMARTNGDYIAAERFKQRADSIPENS